MSAEYADLAPGDRIAITVDGAGFDMRVTEAADHDGGRFVKAECACCDGAGTLAVVYASGGDSLLLLGSDLTGAEWIRGSDFSVDRAGAAA